MGKQSNLITSDPILSKNFKYEKRAKAKLIEKAQTQQDKAKQLRRKKEMLEVERKVDQEIQRMAAEITNKSKQNQQKKIKMMFKKENTAQEVHIRPNIIAENFNIKQDLEIEDLFKHHFQIVPKQQQIMKEITHTKKQIIEEETRKEIKSMFSLQEKTELQEEINEEVKEKSNQVLILSNICKKQTQIKINEDHYMVNQNFKANKPFFKSSNQTPSTFDNSKSIINGYFDHIFIENNQQQKIEQFRAIVIDHAIDHLNRCQEEEKSRGFTNCKILILTPFVGDARAIAELLQSKFEGYTFNNQQKLEQVEEDNDFFRIGIKIARKKKTITYFSHFDHSEIIIASPVGLKSIIGSEGDEKRENSFISSVQVLYIDRANVLMMQNWSHVVEILKNINFMPKYQSLKNSIETIRDSFLELKGRLYRQSIVFSEFNFPELNALKNNHFHNIQGIATSKIYYNKASVIGKNRRNFYKIELKQPKQDLQVRFQFFKRKFWDDLHNKQSLNKVILFANSYFEYVKLKSFLEKVNASAEYICEHTNLKKVQSRVARFNNNQFRILLITERAYYFQICQIKKFHHLYFYSLPKNTFIFQSLIQGLTPNQFVQNNIIGIYTKYDMMMLQRLVGTSKAYEMVREYCNNVSFVI